MPNTTTTSVTTSRGKAIVVSLQTSSDHRDESLESLRELEHLLAGIDTRVIATFSQHRSEPRSSVVLGSGKLNELREAIARGSTDGETMVVFDGQLSPGQQRSIASELGVEVIDRTQVILRIFAQRAKTHSARLEIELARLRYELPRVRDEAVGKRQAGGGGRGAKGHTASELRKQQIRKRLTAIEAALEATGGLQATRRERRQSVSRVALVGYTNAGKSTWMRALTGAEVTVQDKLFVTLDTTVRTLYPPTVPPITIADTVGFVRNLPHELLASFRSTLAEALDAQLLLIVVDGAHASWRSQLTTTEEVLRQIGAGDTPRIVLVNKRDRMTPSDERAVSEHLPDAPRVSALVSEDVTRVWSRIGDFFATGLTRSELSVPFQCAALRAEICRDARILEERCDEAGMHLTVLADAAHLDSWKKQLLAAGTEHVGASEAGKGEAD